MITTPTDPGLGRCRGKRRHSPIARASESERIFLRPGSGERKISARQSLCRKTELGHGGGPVRPAGALGQNSDGEGYLYLSWRRGSNELVLTFVQSKYAAVLRYCPRELPRVFCQAGRIRHRTDLLQHRDKTSPR